MFKTMITLAAVTAFAVIVEPAPASAADAAVPTTRVAYRDLNLASGEGLAELDRRIRRASRSVCEARGQSTLDVVLIERNCIRRATKAAFLRRDQLLAVLQFPQVAQLAPR